MWGYPEFYTEVPGGYGTEGHEPPHLAPRTPAPVPTPAPAPTPGVPLPGTA
jgi:hypothetical protein